MKFWIHILEMKNENLSLATVAHFKSNKYTTGL